MRRLVPVFILLVIAPAVAELLLGDIPLNTALLPTFLFDIALYGTGAVLIREIARRRNLGFARIMMLAFAYGLLEEGIATQSLFNPHFPGLNLGTYGMVLGVNWVWAPYVLGLHSVWSITLPIFLTELMFPKRRTDPWLKRVGMWTNGVIYILALTGTVFLYLHLTDFCASPVLLACVLLVAIVIILFALRSSASSTRAVAVPGSKNAPSPWVACVTALLGGAVLFGTHELFPTVLSAPAVVPFLVDLAIIVLVATLISRWIKCRNWGNAHALALASGALLNTVIFGFFIASGETNSVFHAVLSAAAIGLLAMLNWRR
ncbi:hypothetical protein [Alicyclobacillus fodiniaquatilis]|uniref:Uncharacterized protein n=1 Tax=Alicyclobacillus fodiniaquatilis TaxID=1661150 RepID=A0ABW4JGE1_9BACL